MFWQTHTVCEAALRPNANALLQQGDIRVEEPALHPREAHHPPRLTSFAALEGLQTWKLAAGGSAYATPDAAGRASPEAGRKRAGSEPEELSGHSAMRYCETMAAPGASAAPPAAQHVRQQ